MHLGVDAGSIHHLLNKTKLDTVSGRYNAIKFVHYLTLCELQMQETAFGTLHCRTKLIWSYLIVVVPLIIF